MVRWIVNWSGPCDKTISFTDSPNAISSKFPSFRCMEVRRAMPRKSIASILPSCDECTLRNSSHYRRWGRSSRRGFRFSAVDYRSSYNTYRGHTPSTECVPSHFAHPLSVGFSAIKSEWQDKKNVSYTILNFHPLSLEIETYKQDTCPSRLQIQYVNPRHCFESLFDFLLRLWVLSRDNEAYSKS